MKRHFIYPSALAALLLAGCGTVHYPESGAVVFDGAVVESAAFAPGADAPVMNAEPARRSKVSAAGGNRFESQEGRKMAFTAMLSMNVDDVREAMNQAEALTKGAGGYIQESGDNRGVLRIPVGKAEEVMRKIEALGSVSSRRIVGADVTDQVTDFGIRLSNLKAMRTRLLALLEKSEKVEDTLKIETELNRVVTDIELYEGQLAKLNNRVDFVTLTLTFNALIKPVSEVPKLPVPWVSTIGRGGSDILPPPNGENELPYKIELPGSFAILNSFVSKEFRQLYAITADNCVLRLSRRPSLEGATLDFWRTLGRRSLTEVNSYKLLKDEEIELSRGKGALFEAERSGGFRYMMLMVVSRNSFCFIPLDTEVFVLEFWGPRDAFETHAEAVKEACNTIRF